MNTAQSANHISDEVAVERTLTGDRESYGILFERYQNLVYRVALIMLADCDAANDAVQDVFLIGYRNLERLTNPSSFAAWIAGIARNVCKNIKRNGRKQSVSLDYLAEIGVEPGTSGNANHHNEERMSAIKKLVPKLPDKYREIVELRYTEGFSCKKIADFLNLSMSAVKSRLFYARRLILKMLKKEGVL